MKIFPPHMESEFPDFAIGTLNQYLGIVMHLIYPNFF